MDFRLTDEQELLLESLRELIAREITELDIQEWYRTGEVSDSLPKAFVDAGFGFLGIPEEYGGTPADLSTIMLVAMEMTRLTGATIPFLSNILNMETIVNFGSPEQIKKSMELYETTGNAAFTIAVSEPQAGSDNMSMTAVNKYKDGKFYISGNKTFVTHGPLAPYILLISKDEDPSRENKNMSMHLFPQDTPGVQWSDLKKIGQEPTRFSELYLDNVVIDESCLVGKRGQGFLQLMKNFEPERLLICAYGVGLAQAAMEDAAAYANSRTQFGKVIGKHQMIQEKLTDMEVKIMNMKNLLMQTCWEYDNDMPVRLNSALCKRYIPKTSVEVCSDAMQIMGGIGYTTDTKIGRMWIDARGWQFAGGTDEIMVHIAGREILKKYKR